jgi:sterol desaturase/sphingolipid hydroxylase (fatty acid hydroxylase superfamily)
MPEWLTPLTATVMLAVLWALEGLAPLFGAREHRVAHGLRNIAMGLINGGVRIALLAPILLVVASLCAAGGMGLLHSTPWFAAHPWIAAGLALVFLDFWAYAWHILWHKIPVLWRFHAVHHHDPEVDATTALRFHFGEVAVGGLAMLIGVAAMGLGVEHVLLYELIVVPVALFHHANVRLPERVDRVLRWAVVTPRMHMVHHSRWEPETDSNYSAVLSVWDRVFGTYRLRADAGTIELGLDGYDARDVGTLGGMLATPVGPVKSEYGRAPDGAAAAKPEPAMRVGSAWGKIPGFCAGLATPARDPRRGRHLPLALAVADGVHTEPRRPRRDRDADARRQIEPA